MARNKRGKAPNAFRTSEQNDEFCPYSTLDKRRRRVNLHINKRPCQKESRQWAIVPRVKAIYAYNICTNLPLTSIWRAPNWETVRGGDFRRILKRGMTPKMRLQILGKCFIHFFIITFALSSAFRRREESNQKPWKGERAKKGSSQEDSIRTLDSSRFVQP